MNAAHSAAVCVAGTIHRVDPSRLADGEWCHRRNRCIGMGDIAASYSADRIAAGKPIRPPFHFQGEVWVTVSQGPHGVGAYRLIPAAAFTDTALTYDERCTRGYEARHEPLGFYHSIAVRYSGAACVLCGPAFAFMAGEPEQRSLF